MTDQHQAPDPTRHLLAREHFERMPDGSQLRRPIPLDEAAADWRRLLEADIRRRAELGLEHPDDDGSELAAFTRAQALALSAMLEELSLRLAPGRAVGPIQAGEEISRVTALAARGLRTQA